MKIIIIIFFLLISANVFSQKSDSMKIIKAKEEWLYPSPFHPVFRQELANRYLVKISTDSPFYSDRLALEKEMEEYFNYWQPIADERYSYYVNSFFGTKKYKGLLRKLVDFGFIQETFFAKEGNLIYDYALLEYEGMIKILIQVKINYASDVSYEVYTYFY